MTGKKGQEHLTQYRDAGCEHHPECLTCPFPECLLDLPKMASRDAKILWALRHTTLGQAEIGTLYGASARTVSRIGQKNYTGG